MKHLKTEMAARLMEKLRVDSEAPDLGQTDAPADEAPSAPPPAHGKMAARPDAPPGIELDEHGDPIPLSQRTRHHREEALAAEAPIGIDDAG